MKSLFSLKIQPWSLHSKHKGNPKKGAMTLISAFMFFIFSSLGLSVLLVSQIYLKLSAYKRNSMILDYASENGIKQGFDRLVDSAHHAHFPSVLSLEETIDLKIDTQNGGKKILERLFGSDTSFALSGSWEKLSWESHTNFSLKEISEKDGYFLATYTAEVISKGTLKDFTPIRESSLVAEIGFFCGDLPLPKIPLLSNRKLSPAQKENFLEANKIDFLSSKANHIDPKINFSEEELLPKNANSLIRRAMKIEIFSPQNLSNSQLRAVLGFEISNAPVPDGVYLIKDDMGLGGIFVQGDIEEMVMAIEEDFQVVSFLSDKGCWILRFSPSRRKTTFSSPTGLMSYDQVPVGIIIINGKVQSLGGGIVDSAGRIIMIKEKEIPCLLNGVYLTIIASDKITLSSHLIHQGVKWEKGVPYVKERNSQLNIFAAGKDFVGEEDRDGQIVIGDDSPQEIKIQASLTASNKGFIIEGERKTVHVLGSLHTTEYTANGNKLQISIDERIWEEDNALEYAPRTAKPVLLLSFLRVMEWKENTV